MVKLKSTSKTYAMKIIKKSIIDDEDDIEWVQTEKNVFEQASNHPFLVGFNHRILVHTCLTALHLGEYSTAPSLADRAHL